VRFRWPFRRSGGTMPPYKPGPDEVRWDAEQTARAGEWARWFNSQIERRYSPDAEAYGLRFHASGRDAAKEVFGQLERGQRGTP
jgi:hypothetical protein